MVSLKGITFFFGQKMRDREQLRAYHEYANRSLSDYRTKTLRKTGVTTSFLSVQINGEIMTYIGLQAEKERTDINDWVIRACLEKLERSKGKK